MHGGLSNFANVPFSHERLAELRKKKYRSQEEFAIVIGKHRNRVSLWETGTAVPSLEEIDLIKKELGTTAAYLLNETDDPSPLRGADRFDNLRKEYSDLPREDLDKYLAGQFQASFYEEEASKMTREELEKFLEQKEYELRAEALRIRRERLRQRKEEK